MIKQGVNVYTAFTGDTFLNQRCCKVFEKFVSLSKVVTVKRYIMDNDTSREGYMRNRVMCIVLGNVEQYSDLKIKAFSERICTELFGTKLRVSSYSKITYLGSPDFKWEVQDIFSLSSIKNYDKVKDYPVCAKFLYSGDRYNVDIFTGEGDELSRELNKSGLGTVSEVLSRLNLREIGM